jgi:hypothetical protein
MLNLEDAIKNAVERICRDRNEDDKIYIHVSDLAGEAIRQHAKILHDMRRANEEAQELTKAKADGRLVVLPCKVGDSIWLAMCGQIREYIFMGIIQQYGYLPSLYGRQRFGKYEDVGIALVDSIGKTVFLSREEAEKAIGGKEDAGKK